MIEFYISSYLDNVCVEADKRSIERQETAERYVCTLRTHYVRNRFTGENVRIRDPECSFSFSVGRSGDI